MQFQVDALKEGRFKKAVIMEVPSEKLNDAGQTIYHKAHFVAEYINVDEDERDVHQEKLDVLNKQAEALTEDATFEDGKKIKKAIEALNLSFVKKYLMSIEKHKKHEFPFLNGKEEFKDVAELLKIRLFREAVSDTYNEEINKKQNEKINKLLMGNSRK